MAALFGLGRLQPLVDDPDVENIEVDGYDHVWVSYADGRDVRHPPVADSDAELIEILQLLAARDRRGRADLLLGPPRAAPAPGGRVTAGGDGVDHPAAARGHPPPPGAATSTWTTWSGSGTLDTVLAAFLRAAIRAGQEHRGHRPAERRQDHPDPRAGQRVRPAGAVRHHREGVRAPPARPARPAPARRRDGGARGLGRAGRRRAPRRARSRSPTWSPTRCG